MSRLHFNLIILLSAILIIATFQITGIASPPDNDVFNDHLQPLQPEIDIDPFEPLFRLPAGTVDSFTITITNTGDEDLWFNIGSTTLQDQDYQPWDILLSWNVLDSVQDYKIEGIALVNDNWWISGSSNGEEENYFYIFEKWGNLINTLDQPVVGRYGIRDMVLSNDTLYCACGENYLIAVDPETGEEFRRINLPNRLISQ